VAVDVQRLSPLHHARARRRELAQYLKTDSSRYLLGLVVLLCLMSMITLGQTGVVATKGYAIVGLETRRTELLRERSMLKHRLAKAQSLQQIRQHAEQAGLRPMSREQVRYLTINPDPATHQAVQHTPAEPAPAEAAPTNEPAEPASEQP
jgi:hypothetical protein